MVVMTMLMVMVNDDAFPVVFLLFLNFWRGGPNCPESYNPKICAILCDFGPNLCFWAIERAKVRTYRNSSNISSDLVGEVWLSRELVQIYVYVGRFEW
jgi:hypothetical protein